jgi:hypothetical protein
VVPDPAQQRQPGRGDRQRGAENGVQVPAAEQQRLVDGRVVAEAAGGEQEPEYHADRDGANPRAADHSTPPERARTAKLTATAIAKNVALAARESGEPAGQPACRVPKVGLVL